MVTTVYLKDSGCFWAVVPKPFDNFTILRNSKPFILYTFQKTRKTIIRSQKTLYVEPMHLEWVPDFRQGDVVFGMLDNRANAVAMKRGNGRFIAIYGIRFIHQLQSDSSYEELRKGFSDWLSNGQTTDAKFVRVGEQKNPGDILILTRDDQFDVEEVYSKLIRGENPAIFCYVHQEGNDNLKQLLEKLNIQQRTRSYFNYPKDISLQELINTLKFIPLSEVLSQMMNSWAYFRTHRITDEWSRDQWDDIQIQKMIRSIIDEYGPFIRHIGPCSLRPYKKENYSQTAIFNFNKLLEQQTTEAGVPLPGITTNYLEISSDMSPTDVTVTIYAPRQINFLPTTAYAKPGKRFTWTILGNSAVNYDDQFIRVNLQTDDIEVHDNWLRWPSVSTKKPLSEHGEFFTPHGGPIFLQLPQSANVTIRLENVFRHPYVDLRNPGSIERFGKELNKYRGVPWTLVNGDRLLTSILTSHALASNVSNILSTARYLDNAIKVMHNYRGTHWNERKPEVFASDVQILLGWGHAGHPMMGFLEWSRNYVNWPTIEQNGGLFGYIHEIGHNLQVHPATLKNGIEVTNNVNFLVTREQLFGQYPFDDDDRDTEKWESSSYNGVGFGYYKYLGSLFGNGLTGNVFTKAMQNKSDLKTEKDKLQFWLQQICLETGYNLLPFHGLWNFPVSDSIHSECDPLPCFFPDDEYTKQFQDKVDTLLNQYGKECIRSNPKQVVFRGDLLKGMNKLDPQNIFQHDF